MIDFGKTYRTRDGRNVRNIRPDTGYFMRAYPLRAEVQNPSTGEWMTYTFTMRGNVTTEDTAHVLDLIEVADPSCVMCIRGFHRLQGYSFATMALGIEAADAAYSEHYRGLF